MRAISIWEGSNPRLAGRDPCYPAYHVTRADRPCTSLHLLGPSSMHGRGMVHSRLARVHPLSTHHQPSGASRRVLGLLVAGSLVLVVGSRMGTSCAPPLGFADWAVVLGSEKQMLLPALECSALLVTLCSGAGAERVGAGMELGMLLLGQGRQHSSAGRPGMVRRGGPRKKPAGAPWPCALLLSRHRKSTPPWQSCNQHAVNAPAHVHHSSATERS